MKFDELEGIPATGSVEFIDFLIQLPISFDLGNPKVPVGMDGLLSVFPIGRNALSENSNCLLICHPFILLYLKIRYVHFIKKIGHIITTCPANPEDTRLKSWKNNAYTKPHMLSTSTTLFTQLPNSFSTSNPSTVCLPEKVFLKNICYKIVCVINFYIFL